MSITMQCQLGPCQVSVLSLFLMMVLIIASVVVVVLPLVPALVWVDDSGWRMVLVGGFALFFYIPAFALFMAFKGGAWLAEIVGVPW